MGPVSAPSQQIRLMSQFCTFRCQCPGRSVEGGTSSLSCSSDCKDIHSLQKATLTVLLTQCVHGLTCVDAKRSGAARGEHCSVLSNVLAVVAELSSERPPLASQKQAASKASSVACGRWLLVKHSLALHAYWMPFGAQINSYAKMTGCEITLDLVIMSQAQSSSSSPEI